VFLLNRTANGLAGRLSSRAFELQLLKDDLELLGLADNELSGPIPAELGLLTALAGAALNGNQFSGTLPTELGNANSLQALALRGVQRLTGPIPTELGQLTNLVDE
jgi:hypothetical protein